MNNKMYLGGLNLILPSKNESAAVVLPIMFKRAALFFERVFCGKYTRKGPLPGRMPAEIAFGYQCDSDLVPLTAGVAFEIMDPDEQSIDSSIINYLILRSVAQSYLEQGINVVPIYVSENMFDSEFRAGSELAYTALLNNLPLVQESGISWDQVLDFRKDKEAVWKYRSLRLWVHDGLQAKSVQEANDIIADKVEKYEFAIRKHGLKTITGSLSSVLDSKYVAGLAIGSGLATLIAGPIWSLIASGSLTIGKIAVEIADHLIDLSNIKRGVNSEIAIVYEVKKQFGKKS